MFFIGHRNAEDEVIPLLDEAVERHITEYGVTDFFMGHYGRFDRLAAGAVKRAKQRHPGVLLIMVLPYHPAIHPIEKPEGFDCTYYPWEDERIPKRFAIVKTNQRMVNECEYLIAYAWHHIGSSGELVDYARRREKRGLIHVENLAWQDGAL